MNIKWNNEKTVIMQAEGLLLTFRSERRYEEQGQGAKKIITVFSIVNFFKPTTP